MSEPKFAKGGVIEGAIPANLMVRHVEGRGYREYWDVSLKRWVRILSVDESGEYSPGALNPLNGETNRG
ncbi:hypothetical protein PP634_gp43 [Arthrobacter phage Richie]|jgi:hypothetical protein|uniref:Uncharacterized protein n=1 Tax=Arthrobacter phage Richie TaxID=2419967 RepID=A0A3G2KJ08_9CAUD|nr:hypothetical protein PP634_gp43 [Arthrobacter phage Richie]AYN58869.1 hypothetical protein PBI_RICHIE_43 [Arthrobacter phage Richie]